MSQGKIHHKLKILNDYLRKDLTVAHQNEKRPVKVVELAVAQIGVTLHDVKKAQQMYRLVSSVRDFYQQSQTEYSIKVAMFVSRHKVLDKQDYLTLKVATDRLEQNCDVAKQHLADYVRHPFNPFVF